jgi:hypothetical protein
LIPTWPEYLEPNAPVIVHAAAQKVCQAKEVPEKTMSNWIDYKIDVLATSPVEINQIAERLNQPSLEVARWIAERDEEPVNDVLEALKRLLAFKTVKNLGVIAEDENKARRFSLAFKDRNYGIVDGHLIELSEAFPNAIFLLEHWDMQASYSGKRVIRAGKTVQEVFDRDQKVQGLDWVLLDVFAPFRAEYYGEEHEFGSLWSSWVEAIVAAAKALRDEQDSALLGSESVSGRHEELGDPQVET